MADEKPSALEPSEVPRPALFGWSFALIVIAAAVWFVAQFMLADAYGIDEQANAVALASSAMALEGLGWLLFVASCIIHTIRVEAEATRRGVSVHYQVEFWTEAVNSSAEAVNSGRGPSNRNMQIRSMDYKGQTISWTEYAGVRTARFSVNGDQSYMSLEDAQKAIDERQK